MFGFIARSVLAIVIGIIFLIVVLAVAIGDALASNGTRRRSMQTLRARNRDRTAWSYPDVSSKETSS